MVKKEKKVLKSQSPPKEKPAKKKTRKSKGYNIYVKQICKDAKVPMVSPDGMAVVSGGVDYHIRGLIKYLQTLLGNKRRIINHKTAEQALIGYLEKQGVSSKVISETVQAGRSAVANLENSKQSE